MISSFELRAFGNLSPSVNYHSQIISIVIIITTTPRAFLIASENSIYLSKRKISLQLYGTVNTKKEKLIFELRNDYIVSNLNPENILYVLLSF